MKIKTLLLFPILISTAHAATAIENNKVSTKIPEAPVAKARTLKSEGLYQAPKGALSLSASPEFMNGEFNSRWSAASGSSFTDSNITIRGEALKVEAEFGISNSVAIGFNQNYLKSTSNSESRSESGDTDIYESKSVGPGDVHLYLKTRPVSKERTNLVLGLDASFSPDSSQFDSTKNESNSYSGGNTLTPILGVETIIASRTIFGGKVARTIKGDRKSISKWSGGETRSIRSEGHFSTGEFFIEGRSSYVLGLKAVFQNAEGDYSTDENTGVRKEMSNPIQWASAIIYGTFPLSNSTQLLPQVGYKTIINRDFASSTGTAHVNSFNLYSLGASLRVEL